ncbi:MAG: RpiB/LacA/LacB family sugar-phosphate isomerase [Eubacteriales bacterium]
MKTIKDKQLLVGADFAGSPLKEAVVAHLKKKGWTITDVGVKADSDPDDTDLMFHRIGLRVGSMISEGEFERALLFCGTGMGIRAFEGPHVHAASLRASQPRSGRSPETASTCSRWEPSMSRRRWDAT